MSKTYLNNELANKAQEQYKKYKELFAEQIKYSVNNSRIYRQEFKALPILSVRRSLEDYHIEFDNLYANDAIFKYSSNKACILNFASYTRPGGGFLSGAHAQEESLCHNSTLYNVLEHFKNEYDYNYKTKVNSLYTNFAIYSPNIIFTNQKPYKAIDVITCAAPNLSAYTGNLSTEFQYNIIKERIKFILDICEINNVRILILGAFGCGVFKNDPNIVSRAFRDTLRENSYNFISIIFSVPEQIKLNIFKKYLT